MNAVFDIKRFLKLEKRNLLTHKNQFAYASLILIGITVFAVLLSLLIPMVGQVVAFLIHPLCFFALVFAPCFFEKNLQKNNSVFDFILPGSTFEKFLIMLINYVVILPLLCYGILFLLIQLISIIPLDNIQNLSKVLSITDNLTWEKMYKLFVLQSMSLTGYFFFKRFSFIKTLLIELFLSITILIIAAIMGFSHFSNMDTFNNASTMLIQNDGLTNGIENTLFITKIILGVLFPLGLWIVCFFKLREKEI